MSDLVIQTPSSELRRNVMQHGRASVSATPKSHALRRRHRSAGMRSTSQRGGLLLGVLLVAQLMVILDITAVNIALPSLATELDLTGSSISWTITSYSLIFGSLLLFGGRAADLLGRRRMFLTGLESSPFHPSPPRWRVAPVPCLPLAQARVSAQRCSPRRRLR